MTPRETPKELEAPSDREIRIVRDLDAPREPVWKAWTESEQVAAWWGPQGFSTRVEEHDFRPGGRTRYVMVGPDGAEYPAEGTFIEIEPMEKIVTTDEFAEDYEADMDLPEGVVLTVLFEELEDDGTRLTLRIVHPDAESRAQHEEMGVVPGWGSTLDCLEEHLEEEREGRP